MWREILKIIPRLDAAATRVMESTLNKRFRRVAKTFARGLNGALKGTVLGFGVAMLAKLLNPLKEVEERISTLLGQGSDTRDLADRFRTSSGNIARLQAVGASVGVTPEKLNEMMTAYANAIETARDELTDPNKDKSDSTKVLRQFVDEKDMAEGFFKFLQSLKAQGETQGIDAREKTERTIFGERQFGASRRLIEADFPGAFERAGIPGTERLGKSIDKLAGLQDLQNQKAAGRGAREIVGGADRMNRKMIEDMARSEELRITRENKNLEAFDDLKKASEGVQEIILMFNSVIKLLTQGLGYLGELIGILKNSRLLKGIGGLFSGGK